MHSLSYGGAVALFFSEPPPARAKSRRYRDLSGGGRHFGWGFAIPHLSAMKPLRARKPGRSEVEIQATIVKALTLAGWSIIDKTHGDSRSAGWPDLYCYHPVRKIHRWVEVKRPERKGQGTCFEPTQIARFARWQIGGLGVYILSSPTEIGLLMTSEPNWRDWLK
jgi:hypothetical protein